MTKAIFDNSDTTASSKQVEILEKYFPQCFDKHGAFMPEKLQNLVSDNSSELSKESYGLNWLGKSYARLLANENPRTLLSEDKEHNAKPENQHSENLLINGDNLEVLKHLVNAYTEQVKVIYIDPPYNTGSDGFVYQDDRVFTTQELSNLTGVDAEEAKRILSFTQSKANSHSAWLTFMYPRLYVARDLLKDDGVIFISIDENEVAQLKMLCDEVFGEQNFVECICWNKRVPKNDKGIGNIHEYILLYVKTQSVKSEFTMLKDGLNDVYELSEKLKRKSVPLADAEKSIKLLFKKNGYDRGITLYNSFDDDYRLWGKINMSWPNADTFGDRYEVLHPSTNKLVKIPDRGWRWTEDTFDKAAQRFNGKYKEVKELHDGSFVCGKIWFSSDEKTQPSSITYLDDVKTFLLRSILSTKSNGGVELEGLFDGKSYFSYPKSTSLIKTLVGSIANENDTVVDFFAGSGTTSHAIMKLNAEDGGNRRCISVQLDEATDKKSEAFKAGYETIFDITKARIEKSAAKIKEGNLDYDVDLGFKIFEIKPLPDAYLNDMAILSKEQQSLSLILDDASGIDDVLTTWTVYDGIALAQLLENVDLAGYCAYQHDKVCYLMHTGFSSGALVAFLQKLDDTDDAFEVEKLVVNGSKFDSKHQREIAEAITQYKNKKDKHISVEFRY